MKKPKIYIAIWRGQGFLHTTGKVGSITWEKDTPLGTDGKIIKKFRDVYKCKILFLNDNFEVEST